MTPLLHPDDPSPFEVRLGGKSPFVLAVDHAGRRIPRALADLGVPAPDLERHIAWDIGAAAVARSLADRLDAFLILQTYSRLVIDCNRPLHSDTSIVTSSERTVIPGNIGLTPDEGAARASAIFEPYHSRIREELDQRTRDGVPTLYVAVHSFTPRFLDVDRPWHAGVLYHRDTRLAHALRDALRAEPAEYGLVIGDNEPYSVSDESDYGVIQHAERRSLPYVELEIRQDLISDDAGAEAWAARLARLLPVASRSLLAPPR